MAEVSVRCSEEDDGWTCEVQVSDSQTSTHTVQVPQQDYGELTEGSDASVEKLIEKSFEFLLEREPQSAIMPQFEIQTIERYFPEYRDVIPERLENRGT